MPADPDQITVPLGAYQALGWFFENSKDAFLAIDGQVLRRASPAWTALLGYGPNETVGKTFWDFVAPEDADAARKRLCGLGVGGQVERELRLVDRAGETVWVRASFVVGGKGWVLAIVRDVRGERALRESEARFRGLVNATSDVIYRMSPDWTEAREIDGRGFVSNAEAPTGAWMANYLLPEEHPRAQAAVAEAIATGGMFQLEVRVRRVDGSTGWAVSRALPIRDPESGEIVEWFGAATDITERRRAEEHLQLLVDELNHRVKNTLAMIEAAIRQAFRRARTLGEAEASLKARTGALAHASDLLTGDARVGRSLRGVIAGAVEAHADPSRCKMSGPDVELPPRNAHALTLAFHELATNAVKHGALLGDDGRVEVSWRVEPTDCGRRLRLEWRERGGPPVTAPQQRGFGSRLIERSVAAELGGHVVFRFEPAGLVCVLDSPLSS
jgi:PAS domain S-box-containing protein